LEDLQPGDGPAALEFLFTLALLEPPLLREDLDKASDDRGSNVDAGGMQPGIRHAAGDDDAPLSSDATIAVTADFVEPSVSPVT
jgi:hypothetical protein